MASRPSLTVLSDRARACRVCADALPHEPRPVFQVHRQARLLIVGQAPGARVHASGVAWADASGRRLREWLGIDDETFYDARRLALLPMGFCFPGRGRSGDLPPRPECAPLWMQPFIDRLRAIRLTLLIGRYAQAHFLGDDASATLTETVANWQTHLANGYLPLPHPSPRNNIWLGKNPFFATDLLPELQRLVADALAS